MLSARDNADASGDYRGNPDLDYSNIDLDAAIISGFFLDYNLPKSARWLYNYFYTEIEQRFVVYFLIFGQHDFFMAHTGILCTPRWRKILRRRLADLLNAHDKFKTEGDFENLAKLESGGFKF